MKPVWESTPTGTCRVSTRRLTGYYPCRYGYRLSSGYPWEYLCHCLDIYMMLYGKASSAHGWTAHEICAELHRATQFMQHL